MLTSRQIIDLWILFTDENDNTSLASIAERYVELLIDFGVSDPVLKQCLGNDNYFDEAIKFYLEEDEEEEDDEEEWDD